MSDLYAPLFYDTELNCKCGECGPHKMQSLFMDKLITIRQEAGFPFPLSSAYRCPKHNDNVSSTGLTGPHTTGRAADIAVLGDKAYTVIRLAMLHGMTGIGVSQKGPHGSRFIHLDDLAEGRPWVWSY